MILKFLSDTLRNFTYFVFLAVALLTGLSTFLFQAFQLRVLSFLALEFGY
jgi:hypothetical protein